jgi:pimeloyl-ACP methyl ester carboxylesterase
MTTIRSRLTVERLDVDVFSSPAMPGRPTFVLLHGIGMSHRYLARLHERLAATGTVHSIDLPGFGATPHPEHALTVEDQARVVGATLDMLGVASATVVGHSMGTQFAIEVARQRPELVERLVLMGPVTDPKRRTVPQQAFALALDTFREPLGANLLVFTDYWRCGPRWYLKTLPSMMDYPTVVRLRDVGCPVLVLRGEHDPIATVDFCRELVAAAPDARLLQLAGHAHVLQHAAPGSVASAITRFAAESSVGAS